MAYAPDSTFLEVLNEGKQGEELEKPKGAPKGEKGHEGTGTGHGKLPYHVRGHGRRGGPGGAHRRTGEYEPDPPRLAYVLDQLVAVLHEARKP